MSGVTPRAVIGVVRRGDVDAPAGSRHAVHFADEADDVLQVFDYVDRAYFVEGIGREGQRTIQVTQHVGGGGFGIQVGANRARKLVPTAAEVQHSRARRGFGHAGILAEKPPVA